MRLRLPFHCIAITTALAITLVAQQPAAPAAATPAPGVGGAPAALGPAAGRRGRGRGAPAYANHPFDAAEAAQGAKIFSANCSFCHGDDARGGSTGPNLVRAQRVMDDQNGELITPVLQGSLQAEGMPKFDLSQSDIVDVANWLHSLSLDHNAPPEDLNIMVGNAQAGEAYFNGAGKCSTCHSVTGDLAGIGSKLQPKQLQNAIVSGRAGGRGGFGGFGGGGAAASFPAMPTMVTVTLPSGQVVKGRLGRESAFFVSLTEADGTYRSFTINGDSPKVVVTNPLQTHIDMLRTWNDTDIHNLTAYLATLK